jgi:hypothetical protein
MDVETYVNIKHWIFLVLLLACIVGLFGAILTIKENIVALKNPMGTCMAKFDLNTCTCYDKTNNYPITIKSINYIEYIPTEADNFRNVIYNPKEEKNGSRGIN